MTSRAGASPATVTTALGKASRHGRQHPGAWPADSVGCSVGHSVWCPSPPGPTVEPVRFTGPLPPPIPGRSSCNPARAIRRAVGILAGIAGALLASLTVAPVALAAPHRTTPPGPQCSSRRSCRDKHSPQPAHPHTAAAGGMPGWQITLIAATAMVLAAALPSCWPGRGPRGGVPQPAPP